MNALNGVSSARITKAGKDFSKTIDFKEFSVKTRGIHKIEGKN